MHAWLPRRLAPEPRDPAPAQAVTGPAITSRDPGGDAIARLREQADRHDREIDTLQVLAAERSTPWYRSAQSLVPVLALLFSLATFALSAYWSASQNDVAEQRMRQEEIQNSQAELRSLLQRLYEIGGLQLGTDVEGVLAPSAGFQTAEVMLLTNQALGIADRIPGHVTTAEYVSIGFFLVSVGTIDDGQRMYQRALEVAVTGSEFVAASRAYAAFLFTIGDVEQGRAFFEQALDADETHPYGVELYRVMEQAQTEIFWAQAELTQRNCAESARHLDNAESLAAQLDQPASATWYQGATLQIEQARRVLQSC